MRFLYRTLGKLWANHVVWIVFLPTISFYHARLYQCRSLSSMEVHPFKTILYMTTASPFARHLFISTTTTLPTPLATWWATPMEVSRNQFACPQQHLWASCQSIIREQYNFSAVSLWSSNSRENVGAVWFLQYFFSRLLIKIVNIIVFSDRLGVETHSSFQLGHRRNCTTYNAASSRRWGTEFSRCPPWCDDLNASIGAFLRSIPSPLPLQIYQVKLS